MGGREGKRGGGRTNVLRELWRQVLVFQHGILSWTHIPALAQSEGGILWITPVAITFMLIGFGGLFFSESSAIQIRTQFLKDITRHVAIAVYLSSVYN